MASRLFQVEKHAGAIHAVISLHFAVAVDNRIAANEIGIGGLGTEPGDRHMAFTWALGRA